MSPLLLESIIVYERVFRAHEPVLFFEHCPVLECFFKQQTARAQFLRIFAELSNQFCISRFVFFQLLIFKVDTEQNVDLRSFTVLLGIPGSFLCNNHYFVWESELNQGSFIIIARQIPLKHAVDVDAILQMLVSHDNKRVTNRSLPAFPWVDFVEALRFFSFLIL